MEEITIYAIIKERGKTSKLKKILKKASLSQEVSERELCRYHNYATSLSGTYCSSIRPIGQIFLEKDIFFLDRIKAVIFENTIQELKNKYKEKLIAYSHRYGGWRGFNWEFNKDIQFQINTNFGYGSCSTFELCIYYQGLKLAPYSKLIKYRYANFTSITSHTFDYELNYSEWDKLMDDCLDFYNAVVNQKEHYVFSWVSDHLKIWL